MSKNPSLSHVEKLAAQHDLNHFSCGEEVLDSWLKQHALPNQRSDGGQTYVVHRSGVVVGYFSLISSSVRTAESSPRASRGQPAKGHIGVILLGRLAVDKSEQGQGLGQALLKEALMRCEQAADIIGARAVLVHALNDEAKRFYLKYDFEQCPMDDMALMLLMKDIRGNKK